VLIGSALPLVVLAGFAAVPSARSALGVPIGATALPAGGGSAIALGGGRHAPASHSSAAPAPAPAPARARGGTGAGPAKLSAQEAKAVAALRRSITAGRTLTYAGTQVETARHADGSSTSQVLDVVQTAGGARRATVHAFGDGTAQVSAQPVGQGLTGVSERSLGALAAAYEVRLANRDEVAGRAAVVVAVARSGRLAARMWLDDATGLLLREDVLDDAGRLRRMSAVLDLRFAPAGGALSSGSAAGRTVAVTATPTQPAAWSDVVQAADLQRLRAAGWPCPPALAHGFTLLDARRSDAGSRSVLHLTYGDGLDAISVFLERGKLDAGHLAGLREQRWADGIVYVRDGWPELVVWQGGDTVITAMGDAQPDDLRSALAALPRQRARGTLDSLQDAMGSAVARFTR
jgi:sigma-E factor negative regulatory protein RseB